MAALGQHGTDDAGTRTTAGESVEPRKASDASWQQRFGLEWRLAGNGPVRSAARRLLHTTSLSPECIAASA